MTCYAQLSYFAWSAPTAVLSKDVVTTLRLYDEAERKLKVNMINYVNDRGVRKLLVQCKYWIVNNSA